MQRLNLFSHKKNKKGGSTFKPKDQLGGKYYVGILSVGIVAILTACLIGSYFNYGDWFYFGMILTLIGTSLISWLFLKVCAIKDYNELYEKYAEVSEEWYEEDIQDTPEELSEENKQLKSDITYYKGLYRDYKKDNEQYKNIIEKYDELFMSCTDCQETLDFLEIYLKSVKTNLSYFMAFNPLVYCKNTRYRKYVDDHADEYRKELEREIKNKKDGDGFLDKIQDRDPVLDDINKELKKIANEEKKNRTKIGTAGTANKLDHESDTSFTKKDVTTR